MLARKKKETSEKTKERKRLVEQEMRRRLAEQQEEEEKEEKEDDDEDEDEDEDEVVRHYGGRWRPEGGFSFCCPLSDEPFYFSDAKEGVAELKKRDRERDERMKGPEGDEYREAMKEWEEYEKEKEKEKEKENEEEKEEKHDCHSEEDVDIELVPQQEKETEKDHDCHCDEDVDIELVPQQEQEEEDSNNEVVCKVHDCIMLVQDDNVCSTCAHVFCENHISKKDHSCGKKRPSRPPSTSSRDKKTTFNTWKEGVIPRLETVERYVDLYTQGKYIFVEDWGKTMAETYESLCRQHQMEINGYERLTLEIAAKQEQQIRKRRKIGRIHDIVTKIQQIYCHENIINTRLAIDCVVISSDEEM